MKNQKSIIPTPPRLPNDRSAALLNSFQFEDDTESLNFELADLDLSNQEAQFVSLESGRLIKVSLVGTILNRAKLSDLWLEKCDISNAEWQQSKFNRVVITGSKLTGLKIANGQLNDVLIEDCIADMMHSFGSGCKNVHFINCRLHKADFRSGQLENVNFLNCDLSDAEFYDAKLNNVDFSGSQLGGIKAAPHDLKGAIIDPQQALEMAEYLASLMGIQVKRD